jgi:hypothetical protein
MVEYDILVVLSYLLSPCSFKIEKFSVKTSCLSIRHKVLFSLRGEGGTIKHWDVITDTKVKPTRQLFNYAVTRPAGEVEEQ